jgi:hypothetical protein
MQTSSISMVSTEPGTGDMSRHKMSCQTHIDTPSGEFIWKTHGAMEHLEVTTTPDSR